MLERCGKSSSLDTKMQSFGFCFFVGDIMSGVGFRPFWFRLPGLGTNCKREFCDSSFYWKL